jgi:hypothetical protein
MIKLNIYAFLKWTTDELRIFFARFMLSTLANR